MKTVVVVGASLAGHSAAAALREQGFDGELTVIGDEPHRPYDRPPLSKEFLAGGARRATTSALEPDDEDLDVDWRLGVRRPASTRPPRGRSSTTGRRCHGDRRRHRDRRPGARCWSGRVRASAGVHTLRTLDDARALRADLRAGRRLVVVGAGFIGAEVASTARELGLDVTVVEAGADAAGRPARRARWAPRSPRCTPPTASSCAAASRVAGLRRHRPGRRGRGWPTAPSCPPTSWWSASARRRNVEWLPDSGAGPRQRRAVRRPRGDRGSRRRRGRRLRRLVRPRLGRPPPGRALDRRPRAAGDRGRAAGWSTARLQRRGRAGAVLLVRPVRRPASSSPAAARPDDAVTIEAGSADDRASCSVYPARRSNRSPCSALDRARDVAPLAPPARHAPLRPILVHLAEGASR